MSPIKTYLICYQCCNFLGKCTNSHKICLVCSTPLISSVVREIWVYDAAHQMVVLCRISYMYLITRIIVFFLHFLLEYYLSFTLVKTPWRLGNWFLSYSILSDCKNNRKQRNYLLCLAVSLN